MSVSIRSRMMATVLVLIIAIVTVTLAVAYHEMVEAMHYAIDQIVLRNAQMVRSILLQDAGPEQSEGLTEIVQSLAGLDDVHRPLYRIWIDGDGDDLLASEPRTSADYRALSAVPISHQGDPDDDQIVSIDGGDHSYRALGMAVQGAGLERPVNVVIAVDDEYAIHEIGEFRRFMLIFGSMVVTVAGALGALLVRDIMRPIGSVAARLCQVSQENLSAPLIDGASIPSDLRPFAESVRRMLERLAQAFEREKRFTADAAHELRSPLAVAKSTVQAALAVPERSCDPTEMARSVLEDLNRMERVMQQLLQVARLDAAAPEPLEACDLQAMLQEACGSYATGDGDSRVVVDPPSHPMNVMARRDDMVRLLTNLIDNALQHGPAEGRVTVSAVPSADGCVRVSVHDEGGHIPPDAVEHLTERFFRVDASRSRASGGTGLGLTIAAEIARRHGAELDIQSDPANGTTVSFVLQTL